MLTNEKTMDKIPKKGKTPKEEKIQKKALLIGLNYTGCINDVFRWEECLIKRFGFSEKNIIVLIDTDLSYIQPTRDNIRLVLQSLIGSMKASGVLFVHFSGHGKRERATTDDDTGYIQSIIAADGKRITDKDFRAYVDMVPKGCRITIVADCCHSGGLIKGAKEQIGDSTRTERRTSRSGSQLEFDVPDRPGLDRYVSYRGKDASAKVKSVVDRHKDEEQHEKISEKVHKHKQVKSENGRPDRGILLSACQSNQRAKAVRSQNSDGDGAYGAFTNAILTVIKETNGQVSNWQLVKRAREILSGFTQRPGLYCSDSNASAPFLC